MATRTAVFSLAFAACFAVAPHVSPGATPVNVDWSSKSGDVSIPAEEEWTANESDMAYVNALSSITVNGVLVFSGCSTCPKANLLLGQGVVRKDGTQTWNLAVDQTDFDGDFRIGGGKVVITTLYPFGKTAKGCNGAVYVESGATLKIASKTVKFVYRPLHIAGPGCSSAAEDKALCIDTSQGGSIGYLFLDDDATLYVRNNSNHYFVGNQNNPFNVYGLSSVVNLGSYTLTKTGAMDWYFLGVKYIGGTLVSAEGLVNLRELTTFGDWTDGPLKFPNAATFAFYNNPYVVRRPLEISNKLTFKYNSNSTDDNSLPLFRTNCCNWAGDVTLNGASAHLYIAPDISCISSTAYRWKTHDIQLSIFGVISGAGKVTVGDSERKGCGRIVFGAHNTYTGETYVYGGISSRLYAYWHDSIPDYSKLTVNRGYVAVRLGEGLSSDGITMTERWPFQKILDMRREGTFAPAGAVALDASDCADGICTIAASDLIENDSSHDVGLGVAGGTVRITSNPGDVLPIAPCAFRGNLELRGGGTYQMIGTNMIASVASVYSNGPCVTISGGAKVEQGLAPFNIGYGYRPNDTSANLPPSFATLAVSNATWETTCGNSPGLESKTGFNLGALYVGSYTRGVLDLQKDATISNKLIVGGGGFQASTAIGEGAVYVGDGAKMFVTSGGASYHYGSSIGIGGFGYLQLDPGGELKGAGSFHIGGYGRAVYHQYGGTFKFTSGNLNLCALNSGSCVAYICGGSVTADNIQTGMGMDTQVFLTIEGANTVVDTGRLYMNNHVSATTVVNINDGGTFGVRGFAPYDRASTKSHPVVINMDGGCLKKRTLDGALVTQRPDLVDIAVYGKGLKIDTSSYAVINETVPFAGHVAGGVQSIDASAALSTKWIGAPQVLITGDGCGASAVADWDPNTRKLKGVKMTSHGWGYTQGAVTVTLRTMWHSSTITGDSVQVGDNDIGGFTLVGSKECTLSATNSWQKWTRVDGGTLTVGSKHAIPSGTELIMNGGTLNLGGFDEDSERQTTFCGLSGTGGTVQNGAVKVVGEWQISASNLLTRTTTELTGALDLSGVTKIAIADAEAFADAEESQIFRGNLFSATSVVWPQNLEIEGVPAFWTVAKLSNGNGLRLYRAHGFNFTLR